MGYNGIVVTVKLEYRLVGGYKDVPGTEGWDINSLQSIGQY